MNKDQSRNVFLFPIPYSLFFRYPLPPSYIYFRLWKLADNYEHASNQQLAKTALAKTQKTPLQIIINLPDFNNFQR